MPEARVTGPGAADMRLLAERLRAADPAIKRELRRRLRNAARPAAHAAMRSILAMRSQYEGTGLREEVAGAVTMTTSFTRSGVRVQISVLPSRMPPGKETLPRHLDSPRGWKHPVFGHRRRKWAHQTGKPGWFERPIASGAPEFRRAAQEALDAAARRLGG